VDLSQEQAGAEPAKFLPMVGNWVIARDDNKNVVMVDGRAWKRGQPSGGLADKAREIYGAKHEEFIDNVKAFAYFPIAVARDIDHFENGEISVRFSLIGGTLDRCAGILFDLQPNGDYLAVRFNGTEDNVVLWTFNNGKRSFVKRGMQDAPLELGTHVASLAFSGIFERLPDLKVILVESGWTWLPSLLWRMDWEWKGSRREVPWVKDAPSRYVRRNMRVTSHPIDAPNDLAQLQEVIGQLGSDELLLYGSDHPRSHAVGIEELLSLVSPEHAERLLWMNAAATYGVVT